MLSHPLYVVADEIVEFFDGEGPTRSLLADLFHTYTCAVCGHPGTADLDRRAAVLLTVYDAGTGPLVLRLAHPACSTSGLVVVLHAPAPTGTLRVPAMAWLRAGDPPAVVVIAPRVRLTQIVPGGQFLPGGQLVPGGHGDLLDRILSALLGSGFVPLTDPDGELPITPGRLHVDLTNGQRIQVTDTAGNTFYEGQLPVPDGWAEMVEITGVIGLVIVRGLDLHDRDRDQLADLYAAIRGGAAVGIAVPAGQQPVDQRPQPPRPPALPAE